MTKPPETRTGPSAAAVKHGGRLLSPARYRHPGDVIRLIVAGLALAGAVTVTAVTHATYAGAPAAAVTAVVPSTLAGRVLAGLVQVLFAGVAIAAVVVTLRCRRFRLLAGVAGAEARHDASRRLDLAGGRAGLHVCKRPRLRPPPGSRPARRGHHGRVLRLPESVLLAEIYGQALAAARFPVRVLPNLGPRELVDPALMG